MSYENTGEDLGFTELEISAGIRGLLYGQCGRGCPCELCAELDWKDIKEEKLTDSNRFKKAAKLVSAFQDKKQAKLALIKKVHRDQLDLAIARYMTKEKLPNYYASIIRSSDCINKLAEGVFYKVCKIKPIPELSKQVQILSNSLRDNREQRTAYSRVADVQQFIHRVVDQCLGVGAARSIPVTPMKNALSASRLHLHIFDVLNRSPAYVEHIDNMSADEMRLEYQSPRSPTAPWGKRPQQRWRVRHLRPFSYYFSEQSRAILDELKNMDEKAPLEEFFYDLASIYAHSR